MRTLDQGSGHTQSKASRLASESTYQVENNASETSDKCSKDWKEHQGFIDNLGYLICAVGGLNPNHDYLTTSTEKNMAISKFISKPN